jgi:hypothetical protein
VQVKRKCAESGNRGTLYTGVCENSDLKEIFIVE